MSPVLVRMLAVVVVVTASLWGTTAPAQQASLQELAQRLRTSSDFRVRTQAALALGASTDKAAVPALCDGLADANTTVRAASAAALGRLALGGRECLERRLERESSDEVRSVIQRALGRLEPPAEITGSTKYYVAIGDATNKSSRGDADLNRTVRAALVKHLSRLDGFVVAPAGETQSQGQALLAKHKNVKGIYLWPKVVMAYSGGDLKVQLELSLFSYPNKDFKGSISRNLTMQGADSGDRESENELITAAAEHMVPDLARNAARI